jgi:hypothetical protein
MNNYLLYGNFIEGKNVYLNNYYVCTYEYGPQNAVIGNNSVTPRSDYCQVFNASDCANEWTERCQMIANDNTFSPNLANPLKNTHTNLNNLSGGSSVGSNLLIETARRKYCKFFTKDSSGNITDNVPMNLKTVRGANVSHEVYQPVADFQICVPSSSEQLENDPVIQQLLQKNIGYDIIMNIYRSSKRMNIDISNTSLYRKAKTLEAYGY